ncbi:sigma-70 family RNA polymerase sigma factor [Niallia nealsonii]|uniref:RNA polymerase sigma factor n=1 Tax=Niallia nealsonii TaxID=115979 RepID=A0A2N0Z7Y3_9BACI|nr:sigma-70 family RNA polymerase sigma factor [Niallia nealsonii]PKG25618.1 RNA polymerase sigma factor SigX [Niallia nealsonii]
MSSIEDLYIRYSHDVLHFLLFMGVKKEQAEDLVQEVFMRVLKTQSGFKGKSSEKTWLYTIAKNIAVDHFRKQKSFGVYDCSPQLEELAKMPDESALPEEIALKKENLFWINDSLKHCTIDQRLVILVRYMHEFSIVETAEYLGWSESKVKITQHRALKVLRRYMSSEQKKDDNTESFSTV